MSKETSTNLLFLGLLLVSLVVISEAFDVADEGPSKDDIAQAMYGAARAEHYELAAKLRDELNRR